jgi:hypothetical protein
MTLKPISMLYFWVILLTSLTLQACHLTRFKPSRLKDPHSLSQPVEFQYLTINSSISCFDGSSHHQLRVQFRFQRGSLIWFSARTPWGLEVARGMITPTAVKLIDHLHRTYTIYDYAALQAQWQCPCSYDILQAILLGELPDAYNNRESRQTNEYTIIQQQKGTWKLEATINKAIGRIEHLKFLDVLTQAQCQAHYREFKVYPQGSLFRHAQLYLGNLIVELSHTSVHGSDQALNFPFSIPRQYVKP